MNSKQTEADYVPYGPEWEKEMSKFPKPKLIKMLGKAYQEKKELKQSLPSKPVGDVEDKKTFFEWINNNRLFFVDEVRGWLKMVDSGDISFSKFVELFNEKVFKFGYAAAPQKGGLPKLDEPLISQQDLEDYEKMEREEKSPLPSEAGDGWDDEDWIKFIQWYAGMNRSSVLQGINQYKSQTPDQ